MLGAWYQIFIPLHGVKIWYQAPNTIHHDFTESEMFHSEKHTKSLWLLMAGVEFEYGYHTVNNFGGKNTLANLANYSNSPSFLPIFMISIALPMFYNYLLPINPEKASWSAISYALTYVVAPYDLLVMLVISPIAATYRSLEIIHR